MESAESRTDANAQQARPRRKPKRDRKYKPKAPDLVQDADVSFFLFHISRKK